MKRQSSPSSPAAAAAAQQQKKKRVIVGWEGFRQILQEYKQAKGHCSVPRRYATESGANLGNWVHDQRAEYKLFQAGKKSQITQERIDLLNALGFEWKVDRDPWEEKFQLLKEYKAIKGGCRVPTRYKTDAGVPLGSWANVQRSQYKLLKEGKKSNMTQERIDRLNELGFEWKVDDNPNRIGWDAHYQLLCEYREANGNCRVPASYSTQSGINLGAWVGDQRSKYKLFQEGKTASITQERIDLLNGLGFQWEINKSKKWAASVLSRMNTDQSTNQRAATENAAAKKPRATAKKPRGTNSQGRPRIAACGSCVGCRTEIDCEACLQCMLRMDAPGADKGAFVCTRRICRKPVPAVEKLPKYVSCGSCACCKVKSDCGSCLQCMRRKGAPEEDRRKLPCVKRICRAPILNPELPPAKKRNAQGPATI